MSTNNKYSPLNALIYTSIQNNVPAESESVKVQRWANELLLKGAINSTPAELQAEYNQILGETTIKRACCLAKANGSGWEGYRQNGKYITTYVKIPTPENYVYGELDANTRVAQEFGYIEKEVYVPTEMCSSVGIDVTQESGFDQCDTFYKTYCTNQKYFYDLENNGQYDSDQFAIYTNYECPCFADYPPDFFLNIAAENGAGVCYLPNCKLGGSNYVYFDPASRETKNVCTANICSQINNIAAAEAIQQGTVNISNQNIIKCGITAPTKSESNTTTVKNKNTAVTNLQTQNLAKEQYYKDNNGNISLGGSSKYSGKNVTTTTITTPTTTTTTTPPTTTTTTTTTPTTPPTTTTTTTPTTKTTTTPSTTTKTPTTTTKTPTPTTPTTTTPTTTTPTTPTTPTTSHKKMYIIIGVSVVVLLILAIIIAIVMMKNKKKN
jgi:hypothetical protein